MPSKTTRSFIHSFIHFTLSRRETDEKRYFRCFFFLWRTLSNLPGRCAMCRYTLELIQVNVRSGARRAASRSRSWHTCRSTGWSIPATGLTAVTSARVALPARATCARTSVCTISRVSSSSKADTWRMRPEPPPTIPPSSLERYHV